MKRHFAYNLISLGSRLLVGLVLFVMLARLWGPAKFGLFTFVFSFSTLLVLLVDFGFHLYLMREVARSPSQAAALIAESFRAKLVLATAAVAIGLCLVAVIGENALPPELVLPLFLTALALSFSELFAAPLRALGHYDQEAIVVAVSNLVQFVLVGVTAWYGGGVVQVAWAMLISRSLFLSLAHWKIRQAVPLLNLRRSGARVSIATLRRVWTYGVESTLYLAWSQLDVVAIRALFGTEAVGTYSAGQKIVTGLSAFTAVTGNVMIPRLSRLAIASDAAFWTTARNTIVIMTLIGASLAIPLVLFSGHIIDLLYGHHFRNLIEIMPYLGGVLILKYTNVATVAAAVAAGLYRTRILAPLLGLMGTAALLPVVITMGTTLPRFMSAYLLGMVLMTIIYVAFLYRARISRTIRVSR